MLDEGKKAVTIRVDDVLGVGGFVQPDDRVDVMLTRTMRGADESREGSAYTDLLLQDVRVLAIDQFADRDSKAKPAKTVTVEVATEDAQKLVLAASIGQLSLALRRAGVSQVGEAQRIGIEDLVEVERHRRLQARRYRDARHRPQAVPGSDRNGGRILRRGGKRGASEPGRWRRHRSRRLRLTAASGPTSCRSAHRLEQRGRKYRCRTIWSRRFRKDLGEREQN